ncbi:MAG: hypothetical protein K0Q60_3504, partial [Microvirga sp.]|nr:hypothetical protein [Microvirga sp.]
MSPLEGEKAFSGQGDAASGDNGDTRARIKIHHTPLFLVTLARQTFFGIY